MDYYLCDLCGASKLTKFEMMEHQRKAHDKREFSCEQCNVNVIGYNSLQTHLRVHKKVKCAECLGWLYQHMGEIWSQRKHENTYHQTSPLWHFWTLRRVTVESFGWNDRVYPLCPENPWRETWLCCQWQRQWSPCQETTQVNSKLQLQKCLILCRFLCIEINDGSVSD